LQFAVWNFKRANNEVQTKVRERQKKKEEKNLNQNEQKDKNQGSPKDESQRSPTATSFSCSSAKSLTRHWFRFSIALKKKIRFSRQRKSLHCCNSNWFYSQFLEAICRVRMMRISLLEIGLFCLFSNMAKNHNF